MNVDAYLSSPNKFGSEKLDKNKFIHPIILFDPTTSLLNESLEDFNLELDADLVIIPTFLIDFDLTQIPSLFVEEPEIVLFYCANTVEHFLVSLLENDYSMENLNATQLLWGLFFGGDILGQPLKRNENFLVSLNKMVGKDIDSVVIDWLKKSSLTNVHSNAFWKDVQLDCVIRQTNSRFISVEYDFTEPMLIGSIGGNFEVLNAISDIRIGINYSDNEFELFDEFSVQYQPDESQSKIYLLTQGKKLIIDFAFPMFSPKKGGNVEDLFNPEDIFISLHPISASVNGMTKDLSELLNRREITDNNTLRTIYVLLAVSVQNRRPIQAVEFLSLAESLSTGSILMNMGAHSSSKNVRRGSGSSIDSVLKNKPKSRPNSASFSEKTRVRPNSASRTRSRSLSNSSVKVNSPKTPTNTLVNTPEMQTVNSVVETESLFGTAELRLLEIGITKVFDVLTELEIEIGGTDALFSYIHMCLSDIRPYLVEAAALVCVELLQRVSISSLLSKLNDSLVAATYGISSQLLLNSTLEGSLLQIGKPTFITSSFIPLFDCLLTQAMRLPSKELTKFLETVAEGIVTPIPLSIRIQLLRILGSLIPIVRHPELPDALFSVLFCCCLIDIDDIDNIDEYFEKIMKDIVLHGVIRVFRTSCPSMLLQSSGDVIFKSFCSSCQVVLQIILKRNFACIKSYIVKVGLPTYFNFVVTNRSRTLKWLDFMFNDESLMYLSNEDMISILEDLLLAFKGMLECDRNPENNIELNQKEEMQADYNELKEVEQNEALKKFSKIYFVLCSYVSPSQSKKDNYELKFANILIDMIFAGNISFCLYILNTFGDILVKDQFAYATLSEFVNSVFNTMKNGIDIHTILVLSDLLEIRFETIEQLKLFFMNVYVHQGYDSFESILITKIIARQDLLNNIDLNELLQIDIDFAKQIEILLLILKHNNSLKTKDNFLAIIEFLRLELDNFLSIEYARLFKFLNSSFLNLLEKEIREEEEIVSAIIELITMLIHAIFIEFDDYKHINIVENYFECFEQCIQIIVCSLSSTTTVTTTAADSSSTFDIQILEKEILNEYIDGINLSWFIEEMIIQLFEQCCDLLVTSSQLTTIIGFIISLIKLIELFKTSNQLISSLRITWYRISTLFFPMNQKPLTIESYESINFYFGLHILNAFSKRPLAYLIGNRNELLVVLLFARKNLDLYPDELSILGSILKKNFPSLGLQMNINRLYPCFELDDNKTTNERVNLLRLADMFQLTTIENLNVEDNKHSPALSALVTEQRLFLPQRPPSRAGGERPPIESQSNIIKKPIFLSDDEDRSNEFAELSDIFDFEDRKFQELSNTQKQEMQNQLDNCESFTPDSKLGDLLFPKKKLNGTSSDSDSTDYHGDQKQQTHITFSKDQIIDFSDDENVSSSQEDALPQDSDGDSSYYSDGI
eukprot:TRINITY_DN2273_c0_g1_i1.p1 TRINITY_DN2273_c0_g1~~TRINITY_DN2273_c0_g1_i1.p1  ORF type:complete len:1559 (+),score=505.32 TRINITY_DN2273_c0_g1_i1:406-4677(+)